VGVDRKCPFDSLYVYQVQVWSAPRSRRKENRRVSGGFLFYCYNKEVKKVLFLSTIYFLLATSVFAQSVDILWQGEGYTPPFYKGRTLWSNQSIITLVAIPQGAGNPSSLNYKWIKNGTVLGLVSGAGRSSLSFADTVFSKPQTIEVEILNAAEEELASNSVTILPTLPLALVYEDNPLYGVMFHREASSGYRLRGEEVTFTTFPLFFSAVDRGDPNVSYSWKTNTGVREDKNSVTYRIPEGASGASTVSVELSFTDLIRQTADRSFLVKFGDEE
jgi:hypothetical protein